MRQQTIRRRSPGQRGRGPRRDHVSHSHHDFWRPQPRRVTVEQRLHRKTAPAALLGMVLLGAMLVHLVEYHTGPSVTGMARRVGYVPLLASIYALGGVGAWSVVAHYRALCRRRQMVACEVARLRATQRAGGAHAAPRTRPVQTVDVALPRSPRRYLVLLLSVIVAQAAAYAALSALLPIHHLMLSTHGLAMTTDPRPTLALPPVQVAIAGLVSMVAWAIEQRVVRVHREVDALHAAAAVLVAATESPASRGAPQTVLAYASALIAHAPCSRPPPCAAL